MLSFHSHKVSGLNTHAFSSLQPSGLQPGRRVQRILPGPCGSPARFSSRLSLCPIALPALHLLWKLELGQRLGILCLLIGILIVFDFLLPARFFFPGSQVFFSGSSTTIRFSSTSGQYVVPAFHPGSQSGQACVLPAFDDDGAGPLLLDFSFRPGFLGPSFLRIRFFTMCLYCFRTATITRTAIDFSLGVGVVGVYFGVSKLDQPGSYPGFGL
jgi:hypothetical protein